MLVTSKELVTRARACGHAAGAGDAIDLETAQSLLLAAEVTRVRFFPQIPQTTLTYTEPHGLVAQVFGSVGKA